METTTQPVAGWYRDPSHRHEHRWWDGTAWTPHVMSVGLRSVDYGDASADPSVVADVAEVADVEAVPEDALESGPVAHGRRWPLAVWCLVLLGAGLMVVGALLPWAESSSSGESLSRAGIDGNGSATLCLAIGVALLCTIGPRRSWAALLMIGGALVAGAVAVHDAIDVSDKADALMQQLPSVSAGVGVGVWVSIAGAAVALAGGLVALVAARRA